LAHNFCRPSLQIHRCFVETVCRPGVLPIFPSGRTLCPASPSLQWVPWTSVPHLPGPECFRSHRYYDRLRLPDAHLTALSLSVALRYHACSQVSLLGERERIAEAMDFVPPVSVRPFSMETSGSPKFPSYPFMCMPCSQTPVVSSQLAIAPSRTAAFRPFDNVGFPTAALVVILLTTTIHISGFNDTACILAPPGSAPSLTGTHAGFASDLPAQL
jgi:hypothetical protein